MKTPPAIKRLRAKWKNFRPKIKQPNGRVPKSPEERDDIDEARRLIKSGVSIHKASQIVGWPYSSLYYHVRDAHPSFHGKTSTISRKRGSSRGREPLHTRPWVLKATKEYIKLDGEQKGMATCYVIARILDNHYKYRTKKKPTGHSR